MINFALKTLSVYLSVNVCCVWGEGGLLVKGGCRWILYSRGWQLEHRGLPGPEDNMAASISIFSSKVQSFMAAMAALWVSRRKVRGMSQKTCWGPRLILFPVSVISSMLAMAGLSDRVIQIDRLIFSGILNYNGQVSYILQDNKSYNYCQGFWKWTSYSWIDSDKWLLVFKHISLPHLLNMSNCLEIILVTV